MPKNKKICLIFYYTKENRYSFNVLLGALETFWEKGMLPQIPVIFFKEGKDPNAILGQIYREYELLCLCFSFFTTQIFQIFPLVKSLRKEFPQDKLILVAGGPHATGDPLGTLLAGFDYVFLSEAEITFPLFLKYLLEGKEITQLKGLGYLQDGKFVSTGRGYPVDLNEFPPLAIKSRRFNPLEITRGCPFACSYCQTSQIFGTKVRHRSPERVFFYVEKLLSYGLKDFRFITPNAFSYLSPDGKRVNLEDLRNFLRELKALVDKKGGRVFFGTFPSEVRPEHTTEETVALVKEYCANQSLIIGAQSGSERILKLCRRGHSTEDVEKAVKTCLKFGITPKVDFIFGLPYEKEEDIKETIAFMRKLAKLGAVIHAHTFMPLPQTPFQNKRAGRISRQLYELIQELLPKGKLFGAWQKQMELATKIETYLKEIRLKRKDALN